MVGRFLLCITVFCSSQSLLSKTHAQVGDLFELELVRDDLVQAKRALTIFDLDDDGSIDQKEQELIDWEDQHLEPYDLNGNGRLTQSEIAIRFAHQRRKHGITQEDVNTVDGILELHDKNSDNRLDANEAKRWVGLPEDCDLDEDTFLSEEEIRRAAATERGYRRASGIEGADQNLARIYMSENDTNGDRKLDIAEFNLAPPVKERFKDIDENGNGKVELIELATSFAKQRMGLGLTPYDQTQIHNVFKRDKNRDGMISLLDFPATFQQFQIQQDMQSLGPGHPFKKLLSRFDANDDKTVSRKEVESTFAKERKAKGSLLVDHRLGSKMLVRHDRDRNNFIDEEELFDSPRQGQLGKTVLAKADRNRDSKLSLDELVFYFAKQRTEKK